MPNVRPRAPHRAQPAPWAGWSALLLALLACGESTPPEQAERPNIVFILADDLGWRDVSYAGSAYPTPHIDRLALEGLAFDAAYAASPSCSPTRAAILTGRHPARIGLTKAIRNRDYIEAQDTAERGPSRARFLAPDSLTYLPESEETFATLLAAAGYTTGFVGKWHLGLPPNVPSRRGFDWTRAVGFYSASPYYPPYQVEKVADVGPTEYLTDRLTTEAVAFLREERDGPFCLFLSHYAVHGPWQTKPRLQERMRSVLPSEGDQTSTTYGAMIASLDESVGRILDELDALGLAENTLVIFTSDNGPTLQKNEDQLTTTAPLRGGKLDLYEGGLRVPLVVRWPARVAPGTRSDERVVSMDFHPTFLRLAGIPLEGRPALDGVDLSAVLEGGTLERESLYFHVPHRDFKGALRKDAWKLVYDYDDERAELYDLARDPGESRDLAEAEPERSEALRTELFEWLEAVDAGMPRVNPDRE